MKDYEPDLHVRCVSAIPFRYLRDKGIRFYAIDLDQTLIDRRKKFDESAINALRKGLNDGIIEDLVILTNALTRRDKTKKAEIKVQLDGKMGRPIKIISLGFPERKPKPKGLETALMEFGYESLDEVAVIGDQPVSDIAGGNRLGLLTILVKPYGSYGLQTWVSGRAVRNKLIRWWLARIHNRTEEKNT